MSARNQDAAAQARIAVIGGGAAGFFGAIACARENPSAKVVLLEATAHPLAKVRISGGGRCNVTHACFDPRELVRSYPRGSRELLGAFHRFQPRDTVAWFEAEGVELKVEPDGRMFPVTDDSATIVDCLMRVARETGVELRTRCGVTRVELRRVSGDQPERGGGTASALPRNGLSAECDGTFAVHLVSGEVLTCDRLLLATGGTRSSAGFAIAASFGHAIEPLVPSLFTFHVADARLKDLAGVSVGQVEVSLEGQRERHTGPLLVTHVGLSGPAILRLSAWEARSLAVAGYQARLVVNFSPQHRNREALMAALAAGRAKSPRRQVSTACPLELPVRLWEKLVAAAGIEPGQNWAGVSNEALDRLAGQVGAATFPVSGKTMNKEEFVTCGGVRLSEVDFRTMESRICPGFHLAGEVLDIDGITGGFNFQSAWTTGWIAGKAMAKPMTNDQ
jgi:predicted flavoprotein YhiN